MQVKNAIYICYFAWTGILNFFERIAMAHALAKPKFFYNTHYTESPSFSFPPIKSTIY